VTIAFRESKATGGPPPGERPLVGEHHHSCHRRRRPFDHLQHFRHSGSRVVGYSNSRMVAPCEGSGQSHRCAGRRRAGWIPCGLSAMDALRRPGGLAAHSLRASLWRTSTGARQRFCQNGGDGEKQVELHGAALSAGVRSMFAGRGEAVPWIVMIL